MSGPRRVWVAVDRNGRELSWCIARSAQGARTKFEVSTPTGGAAVWRPYWERDGCQVKTLSAYMEWLKTHPQGGYHAERP